MFSAKAPYFILVGGLLMGLLAPPALAEDAFYSFGGFGEDGKYPNAGLSAHDGTLYGITPNGGANSGGTVFKITTTGAETPLHSFGHEKDGSQPRGGLTIVGSTLYGVTSEGGDKGQGTVFSLPLKGKEGVLYSFKGGKTDGANPLAPLLEVDGSLYGTTKSGGSANCTGGCGTVFQLPPGGGPKILHFFQGSPNDGAYPAAGLINVNGTLYGTTFNGGSANCNFGCGTIFKITTAGDGYKVLHFFEGSPHDGMSPSSGSLINVGGTLYGTTQAGGANCPQMGCGTVFKITTAGSGYKMLYSFGLLSNGAYPDGLYPMAGLVNVKGTLYGTASGGGTGCGAGTVDCGTVFKITTAGAESLVYAFRGSSHRDGAVPQAGLINLSGILYGTTSIGGVNCPDDTNPDQGGCGTVFKVTP